MLSRLDCYSSASENAHERRNVTGDVSRQLQVLLLGVEGLDDVVDVSDRANESIVLLGQIGFTTVKDHLVELFARGQHAKADFDRVAHEKAI